MVCRAPREEENQEDSWLQSLRKKGEEAYSKIVDVNQRLGYIDRARDLSNKYERQSLFKRLERDAIDLLIGLLAVMLIAGLTIVFSVLLGALVGSLAGPGGAALGAFIGLKISVALVEFFGLVAIMTFVYATLKEAGLHYWNFLTLAWNSQGNEQQIDKAAQECAEGNVTIAALLEGIVLYGIGRGLTATMAKFKNSRFVQWVGVDRFEAWLKGKFKQKEPMPEKGPTEKGVDEAQKAKHENSDAKKGVANPYLDGLEPIPGTRETGVARAARLEVELVKKTGKGTTDWTADEVEFIKRSDRLPQGVVGHHINSVVPYSEWAGDPRNIKFVRGQTGNLIEHGGNFQNSTTGPLIDRQAILNAYETGE